MDRKLVDQLIEALNMMLLSADCSWETFNEGHDWAFAAHFGRKILKRALAVRTDELENLKEE